MKKERGFTLIELMITIVVLSIIVAIAFPSYMAQARKSRRADATAALGKATMVMESCRADLATFTGCGARLDAASEENYYAISVNIPVTGLSYTLTATAQGAQQNDDLCDTVTLTSAGTKGYTGTAPDVATCWGG
jgi:type IV pilus assembly protein PilE